MRIRIANLGAPIVTVRTDGDIEVSIDEHVPPPRAEEMIQDAIRHGQVPLEDPEVIHKMVTEAYMPPWPQSFPPSPRHS